MRPCSRLVRTQAMPWPPFTRRQKGWTTSSLRTPSLGGAGGAGRTGMFCSSANPPHPGLVRVGALLEHGRLDAGDPDDVMEEVDQVLWTLQPLDVAGANVLVLPLIATTCRVQPRLSPGSWLGQAQARSEGANQVFRHVVPLPTRRQVAAISMHTWDPRGLVRSAWPDTPPRHPPPCMAARRTGRRHADGAVNFQHRGLHGPQLLHAVLAQRLQHVFLGPRAAGSPPPAGPHEPAASGSQQAAAARPSNGARARRPRGPTTGGRSPRAARRRARCRDPHRVLHRVADDQLLNDFGGALVV